MVKDLIERLALALAKAHDAIQNPRKNYAATSYRAGASVDYWDSLARAALEASSQRIKELEGEVERRDELLRQAKDALMHGNFEEGCCMCGDPVDGHSIGSGHSPVDAGIYYTTQLVEQIDALLQQKETSND